MGKRKDMDDLFGRTNDLRLDVNKTDQQVQNLITTVTAFIAEGREERDGLMETNHKLDTYKQSQEVFEDKVVGYMEKNDKKLEDISVVNNKFQKIIYVSGSFIIAIVALGALLSWVSEMRPLATDVLQTSTPVINSSSSKYTPKEQAEYYELKLKHAKERHVAEYMKGSK